MISHETGHATRVPYVLGNASALIRATHLAATNEMQLLLKRYTQSEVKLCPEITKCLAPSLRQQERQCNENLYHQSYLGSIDGMTTSARVRIYNLMLAQSEPFFAVQSRRSTSYPLRGYEQQAKDNRRELLPETQRQAVACPHDSSTRRCCVQVWPCSAVLHVMRNDEALAQSASYSFILLLLLSIHTVGNIMQPPHAKFARK